MHILCRDRKQRTRNYKNFLIYLINYYQLTDVTDETNLTFKKFSRKLEILIQENEKNTNRKTVRSIKKDVESIFEIIRLGRISKTSFNDIVSILIGVAYGTNIFDSAGNIKIAHQLAYQQVVKDRNYLKLSEEKTVT